MLALVKKPHIEISVHGERVDELLAWIRKKYEVTVLADEPEDELVPIESTEFWKEMEKNRVGNLVAGARLKAGLTQTELASELGIRQNMVSDYEHGRRTYSDAMAKRLSKVLKVKEDRLRHGSRPDKSEDAD
jgi:ribosome-binding protein aMBF1 (putative translation factor)